MSATTRAFQDVGPRISPADPTAPRIHLRTRLHRRRIDRELASGLDPNSDPLGRERAGELVGERCRGRLAATLDGLQLEAGSPAHLFTSRIPLARPAIRNSSAELDIIVERLRGPAHISSRGVAMIAVLLSDGAAPIYGSDPANSRMLRQALEAVIDCLDNGPFLVG